MSLATQTTSLIAAFEQLGSRLWVTPHEPQGAVFQFTLPAETESVSWK
jgi:signal transduction histidine kinase